MVEEVNDEELISELVDNFLEEHHKEYFEVEFVKKEEEPVSYKGVPIVWDKEELELQSGLHSSEDILFK
jgi:hypothetical protein